MKHRLLSFVFVLTCFIGVAFAQDRQVSGKVTSASDGSSLGGVSVALVGTSIATQTDADGNYSIAAPANSTLSFSYVGYTSQRINVASNTTVNVQLASEDQALDEVVVVAYGTAKKSSFTGSASTIKSDVLENRSITSATKALDGAAPGVVATLGSGQPGSDATIRVRGYGSINASSSPLYVVDGVPFDGDLNSINPNDIESLTVLKDAAASTLYGSRAANGVIMITTKAGKNTDGKININFKANVGVNSRAIPRYEVMDTKEYLETVFQSYKNREIFANGVSEAQAGQIAVDKMKGTVDPIFGINEQYNPYNVPVSELFDLATGKINPNAQLKWNDNWLDEVMAKNPIRQEYQFDASGGSSKYKAMASMNALKEKGLLKTTGFDRFTGRVNNEFTPVDWFKAGLSANFAKATSNMLSASGSSISNIWYSAEQMAPIYPIWQRNAAGDFIYDEAGERLFDYGANRASGAQQKFNSIATLYDDKYFDNRDNAGTRANIEFNTRDEKYGAFQGFAFAVNLGADYVGNQYTYYYNPYFGNAAGSGRLNKQWTKTFSYTFNQLLTYNRTFGDHNVDVLLGHENYSYRYNLLTAQKTGFPFGGLYELAPGSSIADANSYEDNETIESYFSRVQYDYKSKYFLSGSFRTDGSSRFHKDNRWGNFWSIGGAWKISDEDFLKDASWINTLTLKSSYGEQGNNGLLNSSGVDMYYAWQAFYDLTYSNANNNGGVVSSVENKKISWEKNQNFNVGFDGRFANNRLTVGFDYWSKKTSDMLLVRPLAFSLGFEGYNDNIGDMKNSGFDLSIGYDVIRNEDLVWNITAMGSKVKNKVLKLTDENKEIISGSTIIREGEELSSFFMARSAGVDPATGSQLYWVFDNKADEFDQSKHYISADKNKAAASRVMLGSRIPKLYGSLSTNVNYKGFDFSAMTTYSIGGKIYDVVGYSYYNPLYIGNNYSKEVLRAWQKPGDISDIPRVQKEETQTLTDRALVDASYFAIKNIAIGYTFNLQNYGLKSVRVFAQGDNLAVFSARKGLNPQNNFTGTSDYVYSPNRTISAGVNVRF
ncbi:SusC/RagA family TonB-linked outer membrane protein [Sphingobacterium lactis]|uniref:TonB-linked outer membrane protein, SusC/RagA family n=1 Tax=Sphingobacterium lactis TaxID=797291 RepID=A0A1H5V7G0_9SPHI|nr:TonB-dependent receptor [Sphingobacterium lactis]SEF83295.1 TonB-linked outer membrane protein, SusC/RagA family [Sphingobacterium lactis]